jgi:hypothetical protein
MTPQELQVFLKLYYNSEKRMGFTNAVKDEIEKVVQNDKEQMEIEELV